MSFLLLIKPYPFLTQGFLLKLFLSSQCCLLFDFFILDEVFTLLLFDYLIFYDLVLVLIIIFILHICIWHAVLILKIIILILFFHLNLHIFCLLELLHLWCPLLLPSFPLNFKLLLRLS
jgi:hypothetical protein